MIEEEIKKELIKIFESLSLKVNEDEIFLTKTDKKEHGDYASNIALKKAKLLNMKPMDLAIIIKDKFSLPNIEKLEAANPGFINFFFKQEELGLIIKEINEKQDNYGNLNFGNKKKINIEYVSANPTGLLHVGHARGAAIGDCLARIYSKCGYLVTREYYVNDAGVQIDNLAKSVIARYKCLFKKGSAHLPKDGYHGKEIIDIAKKLKDEYGDKFLNIDDEKKEFIKNYSIKYFLNEIKAILKTFNVEQDVYSSEKEIKARGDIEKVIKELEPYCYLKDGAVFLNTTKDGDDKDRVLIKSDKSYTYLLPDIAYHNDKYNRGFDYLLNIFGADHHGYVARLKSSQKDLGHDDTKLSVCLVQMVKLFKNGKEFKMSKRSGNSILLEDLISLVPVDTIRYFFVSRSASSHLDFDIELAKKLENDNPVYYVQYTHARLYSILEKGLLINEITKDNKLNLNYDSNLLVSDSEKELLIELKEYPNIIENSCKTNEPYKICNYVYELSTKINNFYTQCRVLDKNNINLTIQRLGLVSACKIVLKNALNLIGVNAPNSLTINDKKE